MPLLLNFFSILRGNGQTCVMHDKTCYYMIIPRVFVPDTGITLKLTKEVRTGNNNTDFTEPPHANWTF